MTDTKELDTYVQTTLRDYGMSPWRRAKEATRAIAAQARAEEGIDDDVVLPVPLEWEHRVSGLVEPTVTLEELAMALGIEDEVEHVKEMNLNEVALPEPDWYIDPEKGVVLTGEGTVDEVSASLMKEAFLAQYDGDEEQAQERFDRFWNQT